MKTMKDDYFNCPYCLNEGVLTEWSEEQRKWLNGIHRTRHFSHRTDPKPRPEGYRRMTQEREIGPETVGVVRRELDKIL